VVAVQRCLGQHKRERALGIFKKLLSVTRESVRSEILVHGDLMGDSPLVHMCPFSSYGRCA
jgi:hypothetical protein